MAAFTILMLTKLKHASILIYVNSPGCLRKCVCACVRVVSHSSIYDPGALSSSCSYFQQDNVPYHKTQIISSCSLLHTTTSSLNSFAPTVTATQCAGDWHYGCAVDKCHHASMDQNNTCVIYAKEDNSEGETGCRALLVMCTWWNGLWVNIEEASGF